MAETIITIIVFLAGLVLTGVTAPMAYGAWKSELERPGPFFNGGRVGNATLLPVMGLALMLAPFLK